MFKCKHISNISSNQSMHHNKYRVITMDELKITRRTEPVMFTIRVDKSIVDFYDDLAQKTNRSRNELIGLALEYAKDKIKVEPWFAFAWNYKILCTKCHSTCTLYNFVLYFLQRFTERRVHPDGLEWLHLFQKRSDLIRSGSKCTLLSLSAKRGAWFSAPRSFAVGRFCFGYTFYFEWFTINRKGVPNGS